MLESGLYGSVRGALSNERPYRDRPLARAMTRQSLSAASRPFLQRDAETAREILHVLPGDAARARAARRRPFERLGGESFLAVADAVIADVALDHGKVFVLAA